MENRKFLWYNEIDSIIIIEILVALESAFDIEFADGELIPNTLKSVRSLTETVFRHIDSKQSVVTNMRYFLNGDVMNLQFYYIMGDK